jgi:hypothetical protein
MSTENLKFFAFLHPNRIEILRSFIEYQNKLCGLERLAENFPE